MSRPASAFILSRSCCRWGSSWAWWRRSGTPAVAVLIFEVLLNATSMFNHGNVRMPARLDRALRWIVVTPDMHRVHHSIDARARPTATSASTCRGGIACSAPTAISRRRATTAMTIGIEQFRDPAELRLDRMLTQPFRDSSGPYPFGRNDKER